MNPFNGFAQVALDGSGNGQIRIAPVGRNWVVQYLAVKVSSTVKESAAVVCKNLIGDPYVVDGTTRGSSGDTSDTQHVVRSGDCLWVVWSNGDAGATATVTFSGLEEIL